MKLITYTCDRCGKMITKDEQYTIFPEKYDPENEGCTIGIPDELYRSLNEVGDDKCICLDCVRTVLTNAFTPIVAPDPIAEKLSEVLVREEQRISGKPAEASTTGLTPDVARQMYIDEGKTAKEIAEAFNMPVSKATWYLRQHDIRRKTYARKAKTDVAETERP